MVGVEVDGMDVVVMYKVVMEVVVRVRVGEGFILIEVLIYCFWGYFLVDFDEFCFVEEK